ncbi:acetyl-CoA synthetase-like protein [Trametes maxima]|nr:acetyl-CoA synthetase-like protein [Trametes maxima]
MALRTDRLAYKTPQGVNSKTWTPPPFYGSLTIPELYALHAENSAEHPVAVFDDEQGAVHTLRYKDVYRGIQKAAKIVSNRVQEQPREQRGNTRDPVVGVLAIADSITLMTLFIGIMYLGCTPFPISVRNSAAAVAHLVRGTSVRDLFVSPDGGMQRIANEAREILSAEGYEINLLPLPTFEDFYDEHDESLPIKMGPVHENKPAIILHSSGSTSFPKPITLLHRNFTRWGFLSWFGDIDLCGVRISMHSLPMFHIMGAISIPWVVTTGGVVAQFRPSTPPIVSTPDTVLQGLISTQCEIVICVPSMIEAWSRDPANVSHLKRLNSLFYAGAPLNTDIGEALLDAGVKLVTGYGMTEIGAIGGLQREQAKIPRDEWEYFPLPPPVEFIRVYQEGLPRVFEPIIVDSPTWSPNAFNTEINGRPACTTSDLFEEHPRNPNLFRVYGRADDQIMLSTGEKTNPVPMEAILLQDPNIFSAIIFGRGRLQNGVIIQPQNPFEPSDEIKLEEFRNKVWPTVERANNFAPSHSRIFKEMITVTKAGKPFQYTAKGTPRRHVSLAEYAEEIEELYKKVEESSQTDVQAPASWTEDSAREFARSIVTSVLRAPQIRDDDDLFQQGCDSLQATWIRNTILHVVHTTISGVSTHEVPLNFVYANPTIARLGKFLVGFVSGRRVDKDGERAVRLDEMNRLVEKYAHNWPVAQWSSTVGGTSVASSRDIVLVTGTTGRLGSHLLSQLVQKPEVAHVYALNRESSHSASKLEDRQREAFKTWGLDPSILSLEKVSFYPADLTLPSLGLNESDFAKIYSSITSIFHNAWRVDFNVTLPSFEPLIAGTRNLVELALRSPLPGGPRLLFVSSIMSAHNHSVESVIESLDFGPELAAGLGYGESKWVTEQILGRARQETGLRTTSVRVGQLCGDTRSGGWNTTEWVPAIVRMGKRLASVPAIDNTVSWVPIDIAATALLEMISSGEPVLHLTSPKPVSWNTVFAPLAEQLGATLVPSTKWLAKLRLSALDARKGPNADGHDSAHNLVPFFEAVLSMKELKFDTQKAVKTSGTLANISPLDGEDAKKWVQFWKSIGFLDL